MNRIKRTLNVLLLAVMVTSLVTCTSCRTVMNAAGYFYENPYIIGQGLATTYYLAEKTLDPATVAIIRSAWLVFDAVVMKAPGNENALRDEVASIVEGMDFKYKDQVKKLLEKSIDEAIKKLDKSMTEEDFAHAVEAIHQGISDRIAADQRFQPQMPPAARAIANE